MDPYNAEIQLGLLKNTKIFLLAKSQHQKDRNMGKLGKVKTPKALSVTSCAFIRPSGLLAIVTYPSYLTTSALSS